MMTSFSCTAPDDDKFDEHCGLLAKNKTITHAIVLNLFGFVEIMTLSARLRLQHVTVTISGRDENRMTILRTIVINRYVELTLTRT